MAPVVEHLRRQYDGVLDDAQLEEHRENYVGTRMADELLEILQRRRPDARRVLDVGSGYGSFVLVARRAGIDAVGLEMADVEVEFARARLRSERPADDAETVYPVGDARELPFDDESFDAVTLWNVVEHVPGYERALAEAARVLRPGGSVFIIAPNYAAFRREAHYLVPWAPFMPKRAGAVYLRRLGRDPSFWLEGIHPLSKGGVLRTLRRVGLELRDTRAEKLVQPEAIGNARARRVATALRRAHVAPLAAAAVRAAGRNPLSPVIFVEGTKPAR
jgi:ubiquinone/menaquinone biosynthesis C-methylase UbiE